MKENTNCEQVSGGIVKEAERIVALYAKENFQMGTPLGEIDAVSNTNAFSICDDVSDPSTPAFEFLQHSKRWQFLSFLKRHTLKLFLALAITAAICTMAYIVTQILS